MRACGLRRAPDYGDGKGVLEGEGDYSMVDFTAYAVISIVTLCFGLLVSFQVAHIMYVRRLTQLAKRSVDTGTIAPVLLEMELAQKP